jgi:hypothetical protein
MNKFHHLIEINNEPVKNSIALEKGIAQNLTCNRWSQFVPVQWIKVNLYFFPVVFYLIINCMRNYKSLILSFCDVTGDVNAQNLKNKSDEVIDYL